jgi:hypothetical protein
VSLMIDHIKRLGYYEIRPDLEVPSTFVDDLQSYFSIELPLDYAIFLEEFPRNGGFSGLVVSRGLEKCEAVPDGLYEIFEFWGFAAENELGLFSANNDDQYKISGWLWIGCSSSSARFYLGISGPQTGHIAYVNNYDASENLALVSRSFNAFMMNTYVIDEA